jgi:tRNA dimethylallyltransferase
MHWQTMYPAFMPTCIDIEVEVNEPELEQKLPLLVLVLGPTGSGKTALALRLAQSFRGEILSCDSVATYRGLELGTAKPSAEERALVRHHLLDMVDPDEVMTAGTWARAARETARALAARGKLPIVSGGTGLYLRAMIDGLAELPPRCPELRERLRKTAEQRPAGYLRRMLVRLDREAAERIHPHDTPKLMRAIEIALLRPVERADAATTATTAGRAESREPDELSQASYPSYPSYPSRDPLPGFRLLRLGLEPPRAALYARLNARAAEMFAAGLVRETRGLQERYGTGVAALGSLGYREAGEVLAGRMREQEAVRLVQQGHRNYAKRQMTWFRREPAVVWLAGFGDAPEMQNEALRLVRAAM